MAISLENYDKNVIILTNNDLLAPITYTIRYLDTDYIFKPNTNFTLFPSLILAAGASVTIDLVNDGIYSLMIDATPTDLEYYFLMDYNIKLCKKQKLQKILCEDCECKGCKTDYCKKVDDYLKFKILEENLYYIWNEYSQTFALTDVIVFKSDELVFFKDSLTRLSTYCGGCESDCSETITKSGCGC